MTDTLGIIVDGPGDFAAFHARKKGNTRIVKTDGPRGHSVPPRELIASARKQISILRVLGCTEVAVVLDFEMRSESYADFIRELRREADALKDSESIHILVPNRMIENWFLADIVAVSSKHPKVLKKITKQRSYEGMHGKDMLKGLLRPGVNYNEVKHGPLFFVAISFNTARTNSSSFDSFVECVGHHFS